MTAPLSDQRLAEIEHSLSTEHAPNIRNALELLAEVKRLRAEPQAWHSQTLGYVLVQIRDDLDHIPVQSDDGWLFPTAQAALDYTPVQGGEGWLFPRSQAAELFRAACILDRLGYVVAPVFPMSVLGGAG